MKQIRAGSSAKFGGHRPGGVHRDGHIGIDIAETLNDLILASVPAHKAGAASAISATAYETGSVLGTAVIGSVLTATYTSRLEVPIAVAGADPAHFGTLGSTLDYAATRAGSVGEELATRGTGSADADDADVAARCRVR